MPSAQQSAPKTQRARTPTILQMEAVECGAAALAIVLAYYRRYVPLEELRVRCGVSRDGSKAGNVVRAARTYGMNAAGKRMEPRELRESRLPAIVFWNFNHFIVVEGFGKDEVFINDPATGPRTVTHEAFDASFTGVVLLIDPGPDFKPGGQPPSLLASMAPRLAGLQSALAYLILASLALVIPGLVIPVFSQVFVDQILTNRLESWVKPLLLGMAITALLRGVLTWLQQSQLIRLRMHLAVSGSAEFFWHVLRLPMEFFMQRHASIISQRVSSNDKVAQLLSGDLATNVVNAVSALLFLVIMVQYDLLLTAMAVGIMAINLLLVRLISRRIADSSLGALQEQSKLMATTMGGIHTIETIKACGGEADFFTRWSGLDAKANNARQALIRQQLVMSLVPPLLNTLAGIAVLGVGGLKVMDGALTVGMLVAFQSLMSSFNAPIMRLAGLAAQLQEARADMQVLDDVLRYPPDAALVGDGAKETAIAMPEARLELRDVSFGYSRLQAPLIENFNLSIGPGQRVALVGGSGSGKSTVSKLVMGLYQPWSGQVLFDGKTRQERHPKAMAAAVAGVDQDICLFEGSIRDNIRLWDDDISDSDVVSAARDACIHEAIVTRPGGYDGPVGERGANFSGGQRQRLEIARALSVNPRILVLDEATSALDPLTEQLIDRSVRRRGCACLIVAHRLSTIRDCDEIIVMDSGKVVERGTHESLMAAGGAYQRLISATQ